MQLYCTCTVAWPIEGPKDLSDELVSAAETFNTESATNDRRRPTVSYHGLGEAG